MHQVLQRSLALLTLRRSARKPNDLSPRALQSPAILYRFILRLWTSKQPWTLSGRLTGLGLRRRLPFWWFWQPVSGPAKLDKPYVPCQQDGDIGDGDVPLGDGTITECQPGS